jgi:hypothetical protein
MRTFLAIAALSAAIGTSACGATTLDTQATAVAAPLTSAAVTFITREDGKDDDSNLVVQLLRRNAELSAETRITGTGFDDNSTSPPLVLSTSGPFRLTDVGDSQLVVRMSPDGRDDWTADVRLSLTFADGTIRNYLWPGVVFNNDSPQRTLALAPAQVP